MPAIRSNVEALLIVELDGPGVEVDHLIGLVEAIAHQERLDHLPHLAVGAGAAVVLGRPQGGLPGGRPHLAGLLLHGRHHPAQGTAARCWPACASCRRNTGCAVANVFHAGDGNLHPLILYDANKPGELDKAESFGADILRLCVKVGGVLTGEHGVGVEKRDLMPEMFNADRPRPADAGEMRLRPEPSAQSRERCSRSFAAAPSSAACMCTAGKWRSRTFRGFEGARDRSRSSCRSPHRWEIAARVLLRRAIRDLPPWGRCPAGRGGSGAAASPLEALP